MEFNIDFWKPRIILVFLKTTATQKLIAPIKGLLAHSILDLFFDLKFYQWAFR